MSLCKSHWQYTAKKKCDGMIGKNLFYCRKGSFFQNQRFRTGAREHCNGVLQLQAIASVVIITSPVTEIKDFERVPENIVTECCNCKQLLPLL
jgi:hypothetical protein